MREAYLRDAVYSDVDLLFKWANDKTVRENSFNSDPIPYDVHKKWFERMIGDDSVLQYILMVEDVPIGQIRLSISVEEAEIGYSIDSDYRSKGYGHIILQLAADKVRKDRPEIKRFVAKVKPENTASNRLFVKEGYENKYSCYMLELDN